MEYDTPEEKTINLNIIKRKITELEKKIELIHSRIKEGNECPICCEEPKNKTVVNCCQNIFCLECVSTYIEKIGYLKCPLCRSTEIKLNELVIAHEEDIVKEEITKKTKIKALKDIMLANKGKKILIFSEYSNSFIDISKLLDELKIKHNLIKGSSSVVTKTLRKFRNSDINVLLLNSKYHGSGINLENTDIIILYHKMSSDMEKQVIGRAQRIGRKNPLKVVKIIYECETDVS